MIRLTILMLVCGMVFVGPFAFGQTDSVMWQLQLQSRSIPESGESAQPSLERQSWSADQTALIVCDMWDLHHCYRAVQREEQLLKPMQSLVTHMRDAGATIIHSPSSCMDHYQDHPARKRAMSLVGHEAPPEIESWCYKIDTESAVTYPLDQSDGGEDDTPEEHAAWANKLTEMGLDPKQPWSKQHDGLTIDPASDYVTDQGKEVWSILKSRGIQNVAIVGVHTNMCVLGRPFGLRQLAKNGVNVVLVRDLTDAMYNPKSWPYVSHAEGTQRIIQYIEQTVSPTITSDQIVGGSPFVIQPIAASGK
ncbi:Isochorismatase family protein [Rubripirellula lacrimiformis]|uniref:Isochorismatase family protein n=1 Tax=Rubripirellula lacrimiformis TaxID=1930273 RepID=A0A517NCV8_9BACT|nr:isochorismatase family protein [Rubripirellula lacrimiformis]QDT04888.1 Isochorismatase family protein [Rubripirellula lacrimiformis]